MSSVPVDKAAARYDAARTLLAGLLVTVVLVSLALIIVGVIELRQQGQDAAKARQQISDLLVRQERADAQSQAVVNDAVARIAQAQREALAEHDVRTAELLRSTKALVNAEVNAPSNKERP